MVVPSVHMLGVEPYAPILHPIPALVLAGILIAGQAALGVQPHIDAIRPLFHLVRPLPPPDTFPGAWLQLAAVIWLCALVPLLPVVEGNVIIVPRTDYAGCGVQLLDLSKGKWPACMEANTVYAEEPVLVADYGDVAAFNL